MYRAGVLAWAFSSLRFDFSPLKLSSTLHFDAYIAFTPLRDSDGSFVRQTYVFPSMKYFKRRAFTPSIRHVASV